MPIAYSCPHCGKQFSVAEQYAGQTGPCAGCGKPITIPLATPTVGYAPQASAAGGMGCAAVAIALIFLAVPCLGVLVALLLPAVQAAREAARRAQSTNNVRQIVLALHNYHDVYGSFPPAVVSDANGAPLYSGRVLLLPFMEQKPLFDQFDLTQAWDSPANKGLSQTSLKVFEDPSAASSAVTGRTDYLFVTGPKTVFENGKATKMAEITDGTSNTIVIVEVRKSGVSWAEPRDQDISQPMALPAGNHPGLNIAGFADGSVRVISKNVATQTIRDLATKNGGEQVGGF